MNDLDNVLEGHDLSQVFRLCSARRSGMWAALSWTERQ
jgi:hypothetical protein